MVLDQPMQSLACQRAIEDNADALGPISYFPGLTNRNVRWQRFPIKALEVAPAPDPFLENRFEYDWIKHQSRTLTRALVPAFKHGRNILFRNRTFHKVPVSAKFGVAMLKPFISRHFFQFLEMLEQTFAYGIRHFLVVGMSAAERLGDNFIDQAQPEQVFGGDFQGLGGFGSGGAIFPYNCGA